MQKKVFCIMERETGAKKMSGNKLEEEQHLYYIRVGR